MLAIAFAVLISTIIQATTAVEALEITRLHVAVILDLSWMNNTSTWIWFLLYAHHLSKADKRKLRREGWDPRCPCCRLEPACLNHAKDRRPALRLVYCTAWDLFSQAPVLILGSLHLSLMAALESCFG
ncbi:hypothetical protein B0H17DRAFT_1206675 [Mycena rosella]|uniref:Secreted protein n=1 Tax=Mycena rosella TaxID=1033263 RepID=A0AAD7GCN1_MYCRO|nr:hypothetical protein B0H17DRAFT_1206675 [Mycena rosella]